MTNEEMKYKDAIEWLDCFIQGCDDIRLNGALRVGKNSIEKQIPKKSELWHNPPYPPDWTDDDWGYRCPACGNEDIDYPEHHCICGQLLDWTEDTNEV